MKYLNVLISIFIFFISIGFVFSQEKEIPKLDNPMSVEYLKKNIIKSQPRLVLNSAIEKQLKKSLKTDLVVQNIYKAIRLNAKEIYSKPFLKRDMEGQKITEISVVDPNREMRKIHLSVSSKIEKQRANFSGGWNDKKQSSEIDIDLHTGFYAGKSVTIKF